MHESFQTEMDITGIVSRRETSQCLWATGKVSCKQVSGRVMFGQMEQCKEPRLSFSTAHLSRQIPRH